MDNSKQGFCWPIKKITKNNNNLNVYNKSNSDVENKKTNENDNFINTNTLNSLIKIGDNITKYYETNEFDRLIPRTTSRYNDDNILYQLHGGIRKILYDNTPYCPLTEYIPFYPENFYEIWEILNLLPMQHFIDTDNFGFIDDLVKRNDDIIYPIGHLEAVSKFIENNIRYEDKRLIRILLNPMSKNKFDDQFMSIYKHQSFEFTKKEYTPIVVEKIHKYFKNDGIKFNTILTNCSDMFKSMISLTLCKEGGNIIMYINDYTNRITLKNIQFISKYFEKTKLYKCIVTNPLDFNAYLICTNFKKIKEVDDTMLIKTIMYEISYDTDQECLESIINKITMDYDKSVLKFMEKLRTNLINNSKGVINKSKIIINKNNDNRSLDDIPSNIKNWLMDNNLKINSMYIDSDDSVDECPEYITYIFKKNKFKKVKNNKTYTFKIENMHKIKRTLNKTRRYIDTREQYVKNNADTAIIDWIKLTNCIDLYRNLKRMVSWKFGSEITSNAWLNFYEIIQNENIIDQHKNSLNTFHLCETYGSFVASLNHYITSNTKINNFNWYAQSLNPKLDNNYKYTPSYTNKGTLMEYYNKKWLLGEKHTGDIMDIDNINYYRNHKSLHNLDFITGNGEIKIPLYALNEQERFTAKINYCQILCTLTILPKSKSCLFKTFMPLSETFTISLFCLLTNIFDTVKIIKPVTSNSSNSEVYVLCTGYFGWDFIEIETQERLFELFKNFDINSSIVPYEIISLNFIKDIEQCSKLFVNGQIKSINRSLWLYNKYYTDHHLQERISEIRNNVTEIWMTKNKLKPLDPRDKLLYI
jgi:hypothetical protein